MLWLPRWLRDEREAVVAEPDAPVAPLAPLSRRTFLFLGASAAASVAFPLDLTAPFQPALLHGFPAILTPPGPDWHGLQRNLYGRVVITGAQMQMFLGGRRGGTGAFVAAVREETERALAGARREALAGFTVPVDTPAIVPAIEEE